MRRNGLHSEKHSLRFASCPSAKAHDASTRRRTILYGRPKVGKGFVAQSLASALSNSATWLGRPVLRQCEVAYWPLDPGQRGELQGRAIGMGGVSPIIPDTRPDLSLDGFSEFAEDLVAVGADVLIVDNLLRMLPSGGSVRNDEHCRHVTDRLDRIIQGGLSVVLIHHAGKPGETGTPKTPLGSTEIEAWARHLIRVEKGKGGSINIVSSGNATPDFTINAKLDPSQLGDTPFFVDAAEAKQHDRDQGRIDEGLIVARHMALHGIFASVSDAARYLVTSPPPGMTKAEGAWTTFLNRKVMSASIYERGSDGRTIHPNAERL